MDAIENARSVQDKVRKGYALTIDEINTHWDYLSQKIRNSGYFTLKKVIKAKIKEIYAKPVNISRRDKIGIHFLALYTMFSKTLSPVFQDIYTDRIEQDYCDAPPLFRLYILKNGIYRKEIVKAHESLRAGVIWPQITMASGRFLRVPRVPFQYVPKPTFECCAGMKSEDEAMIHAKSWEHIEAFVNERLLMSSRRAYDTKPLRKINQEIWGDMKNNLKRYVLEQKEDWSTCIIVDRSDIGQPTNVLSISDDLFFEILTTNPEIHINNRSPRY